MSEKLLDVANASTVLEEMGGTSVSQKMGSEFFPKGVAIENSDRPL